MRMDMEWIVHSPLLGTYHNDDIPLSITMLRELIKNDFRVCWLRFFISIFGCFYQVFSFGTLFPWFIAASKLHFCLCEKTTMEALRAFSIRLLEIHCNSKR